MITLMAHELSLEKPFSCLTLGMIRGKETGDKPKMKLKATEGRRCLPILVRMLKHFFPMVTLQQQKRYYCALNLSLCYDELNNWSDNDSPHRLAKLGRRHLQLYRELSDMATNPGLWHLYPKHHMALHTMQTNTNPKSMWNYGDESEIGVACDIGATCNIRELHRQLLLRYCETFEFLDEFE